MAKTGTTVSKPAAGTGAKGSKSRYGAEFDAALARSKQSFAASETNNSWYPPDGDYELMLSEAGKPKPANKVDKKNANKPYLLISQKVVFEIVSAGDPDLVGRKITHFFRSRDDKAIAGEWKACAGLLNGGEKPSDEGDCAGLVEDNVGAIFVVNIDSNESGGRTYRNLNFLSLSSNEPPAGADDGGGAELPSDPDDE